MHCCIMWVNNSLSSIITAWIERNGMDREKRHGKHCAAVAQPIIQSPNGRATTLWSKCRISLGLLPVRIKRQKGCVETHELRDAASDATVVQMNFLELVGFRDFPVPLLISTVSSTTT